MASKKTIAQRKLWREKKQTQRKFVAEKCSVCGSTKDLGRHHKNRKKKDIRAANVVVLCNDCHLRAHSIKHDGPYKKKKGSK